MCKNMFKLNKLGHKTVESKILAADKGRSSVTFWSYTQKLQQWCTSTCWCYSFYSATEWIDAGEGLLHFIGTERF